MIPLKDFKTIVANTPLVSIDFIIENSEGKYLLGKRINAPAKDYWFTLGGRILKNESIEDAIKRLSKKEFNKVVTKDTLQFFGIFEHFYDDSFMDETISTHYVVLAYKMRIEEHLGLPTDEHSKYRWFTVEELLQSNEVHRYVKEYFKKLAIITMIGDDK
jgi:colanic acid biosynthesis protein WcaH